MKFHRASVIVMRRLLLPMLVLGLVPGIAASPVDDVVDLDVATVLPVCLPAVEYTRTWYETEWTDTRERTLLFADHVDQTVQEVQTIVRPTLDLLTGILTEHVTERVVERTVQQDLVAHITLNEVYLDVEMKQETYLVAMPMGAAYLPWGRLVDDCEGAAQAIQPPLPTLLRPHEGWHIDAWSLQMTESPNDGLRDISHAYRILPGQGLDEALEQGRTPAAPLVTHSTTTMSTAMASTVPTMEAQQEAGAASTGTASGDAGRIDTQSAHVLVQAGGITAAIAGLLGAIVVAIAATARRR